MKYRAEIDGLRAIAVLPVILFHAGFDWFGGGFVGVDVFFVISGYLITSILIEDIEQDRFSLIRFYERRARRILPALFLVMMSCLPFAWMWMTTSQMKDFSKSLIAVSLFSSNVLFWRESDYFAAAAEEKPLLHTWSLAVEEQYYLLFPVFLFLAWRLGRNYVFWLIVAFAAGSLALSEWLMQYNPSANFYLAPTRAWELFAGSIAAFLIQHNGVRSSNALSLLGLVMIIVAIFAYDASTPFPGMFALLPVGGVVLLVMYADKATIVGRFLSARLLVGIGLVSYSAYLWHQPLFAFARIHLAGNTSSGLMLMLTFLSVVIAIPSWRFVEKPFRGKEGLLKDRSHLFTSAAASLMVFSLIGFIGHYQNGFDYRLTDAQRQILSFGDYPGDQTFREGACFLRREQRYRDFADECFSDGGYFVWGDSHAAALASGLRKVKKHVTQLTASACPPLLDTDMKSPYRPNCRSINSQIFDYLEAHPDVTVLLHAGWNLYEKDYRILLGNSIAALKNAGVRKVYVIGGVPQFHPTLPDVMVTEGASLDSASRIISDQETIRTVDTQLKEIALSQGIEFLSAYDALCDSEGCTTVVSGDGTVAPVVFDYGHLTVEGAMFVSNKLF